LPLESIIKRDIRQKEGTPGINSFKASIIHKQRNMAYAQRSEEQDGMKINEVLPDSMGEQDVILYDTSRFNPSQFRSYHRRYYSENPPLYAAASCAESDISLGTEFDQVFDSEIGTIPTGMSWDDMRQLLFIPSCTTNWGDEQSSSDNLQRSIRRPTAESDSDLVLEELPEQQQETEERFVMFRKRSRTASSVMYGTPLCSLIEDQTFEEQENVMDSYEQGSVRTESYYTKNCNVYKDKGLLPPRMPVTPKSSHAEPSPLGNSSVTSAWSNQQFDHRNQFLCATKTAPNLVDLKISRQKEDDETAVTTTTISVATQSTVSYITHENNDCEALDENNSKRMPSSSAIQTGSHQPTKTVLSDQSMDNYLYPFDAKSSLLEASPISASAHEESFDNCENDESIGPSSDEARLEFASEDMPLTAIDAVLLSEFGLWNDLQVWDENPDACRIVFDMSTMKAPSGCSEYPDVFDAEALDEMIVEIDEILQSRDEDDLSENGAPGVEVVLSSSALLPVNAEEFVQVHKINEESMRGDMQRLSTGKNVPFPFEDIVAIEDDNERHEDEIKLTNTSKDDCTLLLENNVEIDTPETNYHNDPIFPASIHSPRDSLFLANNILRSVDVVVQCWRTNERMFQGFAVGEDALDDAFMDDELSYIRIHSMIKSKLPGVQAIGLAILLSRRRDGGIN
jgi:hypothetical protein